MRSFTPAAAFTLAAALLMSGFAQAQTPPGARGGGNTKPSSIEDKTASMKKMDGYFPTYWDETEGKLYLEVTNLGTEVLHSMGFAAGLGSNDIGIDRGAGAGSRIVMFERVGPKVLLVAPNYSFRATSDNAAEKQSVKDAFARSVLWGFPVAAESGSRVLVDMTPFLARDNLNLAPRLRPGTYRLDESRSTIYMPGTFNFPKNTELEVELTYVQQQQAGPPQGGAAPGPGQNFGGQNFFEGVRDVAAAGEAASIRVHHSFVELPDKNYKTRDFDPRAGFFGPDYQDRSAALGTPLEKRFLGRHRLAKVDPKAKISDPVKPIIYYLDPGTPEPIRSALLDGARWWNQAFEAAGYRNAFRVEVRPENVHPLDIRYNVINWVHRSTRGWSTGGSVTDPRTGEIIKGVVTLGSLRVRQDYLIAEGLLQPYKTGTEVAAEAREWALARMRQLAAHEVGHTLGIGHNYYDSSAGRISVMDYPHPLVTLKTDGTLDLSKVYDVGIGAWDKVAITYGYQDFPAGTDEKAVLSTLLDGAIKKDLVYLSNQDLGAHPRVDQWSNGTDAGAELVRMMDVRRFALGRLGEASIQKGAPMATIEEALVPVYLHHRYQVEAAAHVLGGQYFTYAMRGDGQVPTRPAPAAEQKRALDALLLTLKPSELKIPEALLKLIPARPGGYGPHREMFPRFTGPTFDAISPAVVAADLTVSYLTDDERAARMVEQKALDPTLPGFDDLVNDVIKATFSAPTASPYEAEIARAVERVVVDRLMETAANAHMSQVRAAAQAGLASIAKMGGSDANRNLLAQDIQRFNERSSTAPLGRTPVAPPGAPIGDPGMSYLWRFVQPYCSEDHAAFNLL
ncbi:MAG: zinc-dependent metalloprotease, partial [Vicinamibacteria bacterium]